ncbi:flippase [bacterium]|nr:flippase [bacterium]
MRVWFYIKNIIFHPKSFFLDNIGVRQTIAKNTFWLGFSEFVSRVLKFFLIVFIARILGATEYGKFTFALAFVALFSALLDLGVSTIATREFAKSKEREKDFPALFSLKVVLGFVTFGVIFVGSFFITQNPLIRNLILILGASMIVSSLCNIFYAFFRARQRMEYESWGKIIQAIVVTGIGFLVLLTIPSIQSLGLAYLVGALFAFGVVLFFFFRKGHSLLRFRFNKITWKSYLALSWPLAVGGIFATLYSNTDSAMMGYFGQLTQTGWYNAAAKIMGVVLIPLGLISQSFFPALSSFYEKSKEGLQRIWNYYIKSIIFFGAPLAVGGLVLAPKIIYYIYDPSFAPSILAFQILMVVAGIIYLSSPLNQLLIVYNQQKKMFWVAMAGAIVNIALNAVLIPLYSLYGAAFTTVITYALMFFLLLYLARKHTAVRLFSRKSLGDFLSILIATAVMYAVIIQPTVYRLNVLFCVLIGAVVYFLVFFVTRAAAKRLIMP